jgi:agmatine deiminase
MNTPKDIQLPAEWSHQCGIMLTWPHKNTDWQPILDEVEPCFVEIAKYISTREKLLITCIDDNHRQHINTLFLHADLDTSKVHYYCTPSNDSWVRDHGPITIYRDKKAVLLDFTFNGWGNKFNADLDNKITNKLSQASAFAGTPLERIDMVLEGGAIDVDGLGSMLTTTRCMLSPHRNPELSRSEIESRLKHLFGLQRILWLEHGYLAGDDTDSHIDTLVRFCSSEIIAYVQCDQPDDEHFQELQAMELEIAKLRTMDGSPYTLIPLPWPSAKYDEQGQRLPASYANFLIINGAVLVPTYRDKADEIAIERIGQCFPEREIIGIDCLPLIKQFGSLHCVTMQLPDGII